MRYFGVHVPPPPIRTLFATGRQGNTTSDPGIDPDGASHMMQAFGGEGKIHGYYSSAAMLEELVGRINHRAPVVVFVQAGNHAVLAYGYEADRNGAITAIYAADPLSGVNGRVPIHAWLNWYDWMGVPFRAPGEKWRNQYLFVSYRDFQSGIFRSRWDAQSPSPSLAVGERARLWVRLKNTGRTAWIRGSQSEARLGVARDSTEFYDLGMTEGWSMPNRPAVQTEQHVEPGESATFEFTVKGVRSGVFRLPLRPVIDGVTWMDDEGIYFDIAVDASRAPAGAFRSKWVAQSAYPSVAVGESTRLWVRLKNIGHSAWIRGDRSEARLGVVGDSDEFHRRGMADGWALPNRPAVQNEARVEPGQAATFEFSVKGVNPGMFRLSLRPVVDGVSWMEDEGIYFDITVADRRLR